MIHVIEYWNISIKESCWHYMLKVWHELKHRGNDVNRGCARKNYGFKESKFRKELNCGRRT